MSYQIDDGAGLAVIAGGALINLNAAAKGTGLNGNPTPIVRTAESENGKVHMKIAAWGSNNLHPQDRLKLIEADTELPSLLDLKKRMLVGMGVGVFKITGYDPKTHNEQLERVGPLTAPEAYRFLSSINTLKWVEEAATDNEVFFNVMPEMVMGHGFKKIVGVYHQEAPFCRWEEMDRNGIINRCYINGNWERYDSQLTEEVVAYDPWATDPRQWIRDNAPRGNFIYPSYYSTPGKTYYQLPHFEGFFKSGWYDVAQAIPQFKKWMLKNQMSLRYHVEIEQGWWETQYPGFNDMKPEAKRKIMGDELQKFNDFLTGVEKAGKSLLSGMTWDEEKGSMYSSWKITVLADPQKDGKYLEDSSEASKHKLRALGIDPAIVGAGPGRDQGSAGSGSDKWAAIKIYLAALNPRRRVLLEPLQFIFDYNGWTDAGLVPRFIDHELFSTATASDKTPSPNPTA